MNNHETTKWAPFNAVVNGNELLSNIMEEKSKVDKPILSDEQINNLEVKIMKSYRKKSEIKLIYYKNGTSNIIDGQITKLDAINKVINLNYCTNINFNDIIDILEKNT